MKVTWASGGMVDAADLKSADHYDREGSSPSSPTMKVPVSLEFMKG